MEDYRAASLRAWSSVAPDWGELTAFVDRMLSPGAEWMLEAAALQPGERVLELAGGPGTLSLAAARAVGPEGKVICTDFSEEMVDVARRRLEVEGAGNVECRVMDAEAIDLPDGAVDGVLCRMGYMFMDPGRALGETARVLAPGGRVALAVWSDSVSNPWASLPMQTILGQLGAPPPDPDAPGLWALADQDRLRGALEEAGLEQIRIERVSGTVEYDSLDHWFELTARLAGPLRALLENMSEPDLDRIKHGMRDAGEQYRRPDGGVSVPERMVVALARRA